MILSCENVPKYLKIRFIYIQYLKSINKNLSNFSTEYIYNFNFFSF